jgi:hypothetical protein
MRAFIPVLVFVVAVAALSGCSAGTLPGGATGSGPAATSGGGSSAAPAAVAGSGSGSKSKSGSGATSATECSIAGKALATFVTGTMSSPYQKGTDCYFGVGPNGTLSGATLAQQYGDVILVQYGTSGADSQMAAANQVYGGGKGVEQLSGVGTEAHYWGGLNDEGSPQVWARTSGAWCIIQSHLNSATEVGLTAPGGSAVIAKADMPGLGAKFGSVCTALFGG